MNNPYEVLGLNYGAGIDEVKTAYRNLAGIYSENVEKMTELNAAYDAIIDNVSGGSGYSRYGGPDYRAPDEFGDIRARINSGRIDDAEMLLDGIPHDRRNAQWYFLKGTIQHRRGWLESAAESFKRACDMEPGNQEYAQAYNNINNSKNSSFRRERNEDRSDNSGCASPCNICTSLMCADCCCECMGGDLIRCC